MYIFLIESMSVYDCSLWKKKSYSKVFIIIEFYCLFPAIKINQVFDCYKTGQAIEDKREGILLFWRLVKNARHESHVMLTECCCSSSYWHLRQFADGSALLNMKSSLIGWNQNKCMLLQLSLVDSLSSGAITSNEGSFNNWELCCWKSSIDEMDGSIHK